MSPSSDSINRRDSSEAAGGGVDLGFMSMIGSTFNLSSRQTDADFTDPEDNRPDGDEFANDEDATSSNRGKSVIKVLCLIGLSAAVVGVAVPHKKKVAASNLKLQNVAFAKTVKSAKSKSGKCSKVDGGGWQQVRYVPAFTNGVAKMHPATDNLAGTAEYGDPADFTQPWSILFTDAVPGWGNPDDEFLFATGDCKKWLVATKDEVIGENYQNNDRTIKLSSTYNGTYDALWYNRAGVSEDPWVSIADHGAAIDPGLILYGEDSYDQGNHARGSVEGKGLSVYIRKEP